MTFTLPAQPVVLPAADTVSHTDNHMQLIAAALLGIATIIVLIVWRKMHPFLALTLGSAVLAVVAGIPLADTFTAFTKGMGSTIGDVGTLIAFGAIIGRLLGFDVVVSPWGDDSKPTAAGIYTPALAFISQVNKTESMRAENKFADRVRGLHVYGGKITRPTAVQVFKAA